MATRKSHQHSIVHSDESGDDPPDATIARGQKNEGKTASIRRLKLNLDGSSSESSIDSRGVETSGKESSSGDAEERRRQSKSQLRHDDNVSVSYLNRYIAKFFDDDLYFGKIVKYTPANKTSAKGEDHWGIYYEADGDYEEMNLSELQIYLGLYKTMEDHFMSVNGQLRANAGATLSTHEVAAAVDYSTRDVTPSPDAERTTHAKDTCTPSLPPVWTFSIQSPPAIADSRQSKRAPSNAAENSASKKIKSHVYDLFELATDEMNESEIENDERRKGHRRVKLHTAASSNKDSENEESHAKEERVKDDHVEMTHSDNKPKHRHSRIHQRVTASYLDPDDNQDSEKDSSEEERARKDDIKTSRSDIANASQPKRHHCRARLHRKAVSSYIDSKMDESDKDSSEEEDCYRRPVRRVATLKTLDRTMLDSDEEFEDAASESSDFNDEESDNDSLEEEDVARPRRRRMASLKTLDRAMLYSDEEFEDVTSKDSDEELETDEDVHVHHYDSSEQEDVARPRPRRVASLKTLDRAMLYSDEQFEDATSEDSDEELKLATTKTCHGRAFVDNCPLPPPVLSLDEKEVIVNSIDEPQDKLLQQLLLNAGFRFTLLPHQFLAVRKIAGAPSDFPMHKGSNITPSNVTINLALAGLELPENKVDTKGVLIADEMGLGKTIEAIAGAIIRNEMASAKGAKKLPTVIVSPNEVVQIQWRDALILNGISIDRIILFQKAQTDGFDDANFILLTRYMVQAEVKELFEYVALDSPPRTMSALFPHATIDVIKKLQNQYLAKRCKEKNRWKQKDEFVDDCVTRIIAHCTKGMRGSQQGAAFVPVFETLIIDEAHLLKNRCTYWSMGTALMGTHASRRVPLTGTPYNNGPGDLATLMTFIDEAQQSAYKPWWDKATRSHTTARIVACVTAWHETYLIRRRKVDVLKDKLPPKHIKSEIVPQFKAELFVYEYFEGRLVTLLKEFQQCMNSENQVKAKTMFTILMSIMSCMRSANIHAMIPGGREFTKCFSPSCRHLLAREECPKACVCCNRSLRPSIALPCDKDKKRQDHHSRRSAHVTTEIDMVEGQGDSDDADEVVDEEKDETLLSLPKCLCGAYKGPVKHYAHEECIEKMKAERASCPRCADSKKRIFFDLPSKNIKYCQHIAPVPGLPGGFTGSSKINAVVKWYRDKVPEDDKVLILSFFKGGLDLLEGIFVEELGIDCARFDGDLDRRRAIEELERFKNDPDCKVLFATVQSGGVGLNIVEANHVAFLDRWYNPFVHSQAEDRCYRIGQAKDVNIVYFDCAATIDEGMIQLNKLKKDNAAVLLADGFEIGNQEAGSLSYKELSGLLGHLMNAIRSHRSEWLRARSGNVDLQIPQFDPQAMKKLVEGFKNPQLYFRWRL